MRGHMKKCIRKAAAAVLSAALLVASESPAFAQNIQQTAVPADVITEQSRLEDGIAISSRTITGTIPDAAAAGGQKSGRLWNMLGIFNDCMHGNQSDEKRLRGNGFVGIATDLFCNAFCEG